MADPAERNLMDSTRAMKCVAVAFPDLQYSLGSIQLRFRHGPHRPVTWMKRTLLKALDFQYLRIKFPHECKVIFNLASLFDSVDVVKVALERLFPDEMKSVDSATEAFRVVASVMHVGKLKQDMQDSFAWCMALVAQEAATEGTVYVLDYALQHPLVPVPFSFYRRHFNEVYNEVTSYFLINYASSGAHIHNIHYLLGNPLPIAPPPASRPSVPGINLAPTMAVSTHPVAWTMCSSLTQRGYHREPPLLNLLWPCDSDPLRAVIYLLDQGAPTDRLEKLHSCPLHNAARHPSSGIVRLLVERGANVAGRTENGLTALRTALHAAVAANNAERTLELLEYGASRDAGEEDRHTPLYLALLFKFYEAAKVLLRAGATSLVKGIDGEDEHIDDELRNELLN
ncbi:hypothetical protein HDU96_005662 [Phlyctochytrium bullatum]|nr:hypothetical protein HDU96_005662 [Phlyctochytrium bullatum]